MECAACFSRSQDIGIRAAAALIISDNENNMINDEFALTKRAESKQTLLNAVVQNISRFDLPALPHYNEFSVDGYLSSLIQK